MGADVQVAALERATESARELSIGLGESLEQHVWPRLLPLKIGYDIGHDCRLLYRSGNAGWEGLDTCEC
jgi:hypothetical protein